MLSVEEGIDGGKYCGGDDSTRKTVSYVLRGDGDEEDAELGTIGCPFAGPGDDCEFGDTDRRGRVVERGCNWGSVSARSTMVLKKAIDLSHRVSVFQASPLITEMRLNGEDPSQ